MVDTIKLLAIDLGASSGRVMLGIYDGDRLQMEEIHRFENTPVQINGHLYWDTLRLFHEMKQGVQKAFRQHGELTSLSVDTWGVDYGFIDKRGMMLYSPHHYRDRRMETHRLQLEALISPAEQFRMTGLQPSVINTVYQLFSDFQDNDSLMENADTILMMPDLFHYLFSGIKAAESTIWSTSGLVDAVSGEPSSELLSRLGIPSSLVPHQVQAGTVIGSILPVIQEELSVGPIKVIAGASHDTASAVASIPYTRKDEAAFLSCGTWSLVGMETPEPVISEKSYEYGFTNERCFGNSNRLLKNTTGLWILQELQRNWAKAGENLSQSEMVELAKTINRAPAIIDPNDPLFSTPGVMIQRIKEYCERTGQQPPNTKAEIIRVILESLAQSYCRTIEEMEEITGKTITIIHMVGGGIQNELLCQLTADATGREVVAGPVEASGIGNIIVQLAALGKLDVSEGKEFVAQSFTFKTYQPSVRKNSKK
ncbi:rhamnulokinase [Paenibacillus odorifer]|uniref:Rhamnulokinase n=1 Tax=Paenibacillus odorifer TaxID=189426 RepID=A0A1R0XN31_9BACL|nr:rhamnulokinase family protein [Paenibacillus odorifer]OMD36429.1 rhamnulokinase [Paenibacillus odorifer]